MQTHVKVVGVLYLVCAGIFALLAAALPLGFGLLGAFISQSEDQDAATGAAVMGLVGTGLAVFFGVIAVVWGITGYGVLKRQSWARIVAIILSAMSLIEFPFGTALGIYGLWVMFNKETEKLFTNSPQV